MENDVMTPIDDPENRTPGGTVNSLTERKKPKSWIDKVTDLFKSDDDIKRLDDEQAKDDAEYSRRKAERAAEQARIESGIAERARRADPRVRAKEKQQESMFKARHAEARRLASLKEMITEYERRHPCKDEAAISFYEAQIQRENLWGVFGKGKE